MVTAVLVLAAGWLAGCAQAPSAAPVPSPSPSVDQENFVDGSEGDEASLVADGFQHDGRRYELSCGMLDLASVEADRFATADTLFGAAVALHRVNGVDPAVLLAVPNLGCELEPQQPWRIAIAVDELPGAQPSQALNDAICGASLYPPNPAGGFHC